MKITAGFVLFALAGFVSAQESDLIERGGGGGPGGGHGGGHGGGKPTPRKPLVVPSKLAKGVERRNLLEHANQFVKFSKLSNGTRAFGSKGHNATVQYIKKVLDNTKAYTTEYQTFPYLYSEGSATFSAAGTEYSTAWFTYGPAGDVTAPLAAVANIGCTLADYPPEVAGKIALIMRGTCPFGEKVALAGAAGAAGAMIYNNAAGSVGGGTLGEVTRPEIGPYVPTGSLTGEEGTALLATISAGTEVIGTLRVNAVTETRYSSNVIATTKVGDHQNLVVAGGHSDSVAAGPGINDDGSGTMGLLEVAVLLSQYNITNAVRFAFWTAEEFGLVGSTHYVTSLSAAERQKIALYLNFDMIASPNAGYFILDGDGGAFNITGPPGSEHIERTFEKYFAANKIVSAPSPFNGRSDYGPFLDVGIPAGGLFTGAEGIMTEEQAKWWGGAAGVAYDECYHKACDGITNLDFKAWVTNTKAAAHAISSYALSLTGIPRAPRVAAREFRMAGLSYDERRHQSCGEEIFEL